MPAVSVCGEASLVNRGNTWGLAVSLRCNSWGCDGCAPHRRRRLIDEVKRGKPNRFLTLTIQRTPGASPLAARQELSRALPLLLAWCKREYRCEIAWFSVVEATKAGWPHLHVALRCPVFLPQRAISERWKKLTGSSIIDIRLIKGAGQAAAYVAKYIGKAPHRFGTSKRYWRSQNWILEPREENEADPRLIGGWVLSTEPLEHWIEVWQFQPGFDCSIRGGRASWGLDTS